MKKMLRNEFSFKVGVKPDTCELQIANFEFMFWNANTDTYFQNKGTKRSKDFIFPNRSDDLLEKQ